MRKRGLVSGLYEHFILRNRFLTVLLIISIVSLLSFVVYDSNVSENYDVDSVDDFFVFNNMVRDDVVGQAVHPLYSGFSLPSNVFYAPDSVDFSVSDSSKSFSLQVADDAVYNTAYLSFNDGSWQPIVLFNQSIANSWVFGNVTKSITLQKSVVSSSTANNYVIIYSCSRVNISGVLSWDCHDNMWQLKQFSINLPSVQSNTTNSSNVSQFNSNSVFVSLSGNDVTGTGLIGAPFRSLSRAQLYVRNLTRNGTVVPSGGVTVYLRSGVYELSDSFSLDSKDSGSYLAKVTYTSYPGEQVTISGGRNVPANAFRLVNSGDEKYSQLKSGVRNSVYVADLNALGITSYGKFVNRGYYFNQPTTATVSTNGFKLGNAGHMELFVDDNIMTVARWPNVGELITSELSSMPLVDEYTSDYVDIVGTVTPNVSGRYLKIPPKTPGHPLFMRDGFVNGTQYYLYKYLPSTPESVWYISTYNGTYPAVTGSTTPFWAKYHGAIDPTGTSNRLTTLNGVYRGATGYPSALTTGLIRYPGFASSTEIIGNLKMKYIGYRPGVWQNAEPWMYIYPRYQWADLHIKINNIDSTNNIMELKYEDVNKLVTWYSFIAGNPFYVYNVVEELDVPGEFFIDKTAGKLYYYPQSGFSQSSDVTVSVLDVPIIKVDGGAKYLNFENITFSYGREIMITVGHTNTSTSNISFNKCKFTNGGKAAAMISGYDNGISNSIAHTFGDAVFIIKGGDIKKLTRANNYVKNSIIHDYGLWDQSYVPAILLFGDSVGNIIDKNTIYNGPHAAILLEGALHQITRNDISNVCYVTDDAGTIYGYMNWNMRGITIKNNYIHDIKSNIDIFHAGIHAIYLDGGMQGAIVEGNIIKNVSGGSIFVNTGNNHKITNNILIDNKAGIKMNEYVQVFSDINKSYVRLNNVNYRNPPWSVIFPETLEFPSTPEAFLASDFYKPIRSTLSRNVGYNTPDFIIQKSFTLPNASYYIENVNNVNGINPLFYDDGNGGLSINPSSPIYSIPGFQSIPVEEIGSDIVE